MKKLSVRDRAMMPLVQKELSTEDLKALKPWENPKTAPGASMAFHIKESVVFAENEKLKAELETFRDGSLTRVIDATLITRSKWANRHDKSFEDSFSAMTLFLEYKTHFYNEVIDKTFLAEYPYSNEYGCTMSNRPQPT